MKLCIKQHIFTFGSKFTVFDGYGNDKYYVEGEIFTFGRKLHIYSLSGNEVAYIEQQLFTFTPLYSVFIDGRRAFDIHKKFTLFCPSYDIEGMGLSVDGDFLGHDYCIYKNGNLVAEISREWFTFGDCYSIDISDIDDEIPVLCAALVIDCVTASKN